MAIVDIDISSCSKVPLCLGYTLLKFCTNWLRFVENITVLLHPVNLSHNFTDILNLHFFYFQAIIALISTTFFCFHISLTCCFHFF